MKTALLIGSTGLVGGHLLHQLLKDERYELVKTLVRKPGTIKHEKLAEEVVDFKQLEKYDLTSNDVFCCLGTTIAVAGSQTAFRKVDYDYPLEVAKAALKKGAKQYILVSAIGADKNSKVFYSRVKGELEASISGLGYETFVSVRPSFLLGNRTEFRIGEKIGIGVAKLIEPLMIGGLRKYRGVEAEEVAAKMLRIAHKDIPGIYFVESDEIG